MRSISKRCKTFVLATILLVLLRVSLVGGQLPSLADEPAIASAKADSTLSQLKVPRSRGATQETADGASLASNAGGSSGSSGSSSSDCEPPAVEDPQPKGIPIQALPDGQQPNFIVIITDDQGWDDIGLHNPKYVKTPNLDNFIRGGTLFDNFYVNSQCQPSRAAFYTGRSFPRTGVMLVNGGSDFINSREQYVGKIMSDAGYSTAHVGKWHNNKVMGYEPWQRSIGFQQTWYPMGSPHGLIKSQNGGFVPKYTNGRTSEGDMMDSVLYFVNSRSGAAQGNGTQSTQSTQSPGKPFYLNFAMHAIHISTRPNTPLRDYPPRFRLRFNDPASQGIHNDTLDAWAMLEYMDEVLGGLLDYMKQSGLDKTTYVMIMSDNGSYLARGEDSAEAKPFRMPSGMQGAKSKIYEGGIRNFLVVQGPGVAAGVYDSTLLDATDILPTVTDLAGLTNTKHLPWDGTSFKHLLVDFGSEGLPANGRRGDVLAKDRQRNRVLFYLGPNCWSHDTVPLLGPDRQVIRPQKLFDYDLGGVNGPAGPEEVTLRRAVSSAAVGFERCIAGRFRDYKWVGATGKVYRLRNGSHIELPCNELPNSKQAAEWAAYFQKAARRWWESIVQEPTSFLKPTLYAGLGVTAGGSYRRKVSNVPPMGAHERTPGRITLIQNGLKGFQQVGDRACYKLRVMTAGRYQVILQYTSTIQATFKLSVGLYADMLSGTAPSIVAQLPPQPTIMQGVTMGTLDLPAAAFENTEACLEMVETTKVGTSVFTNLANIQFIGPTQRGNLKRPRSQVVEEAGEDISATDSGEEETVAPNLSFAPLDMSSEAPLRSGSSSGHHKTGTLKVTAAAEKFAAAPVAVKAPGVDLTKKEYSWLLSPLLQQQQQRISAGKQQNNPVPKAVAAAAWKQLRLEQAWPDGQPVLESMYSPYDAEGIMDCAECQPQL